MGTVARKLGVDAILEGSVRRSENRVRITAQLIDATSDRHSVGVSDRYLSLNPDDALALSRSANDLIYLGEIEKGLERANRAYAINPHVCRYNVACSHMITGHTERALDLLEEHAQAGALQLGWLDQDSDWDAARDHPRFKAILEKIR